MEGEVVVSKILGAFTDPQRRQRTIIVLAMVIIVALGFYGAAMMATSTRWFCNDACHNVHADNKLQYYASAHSEISCMACHYPPNMDPVKFAVDRVDKLLDIYPTIAGKFEMPLNEYSRMALTMSSDRCTQCHSGSRKVTPSPGMIIDHDVHAERKINCTVCHNRTAHVQTTPLSLPGNRYAEDFMTMRACFRCHVSSGESPSPAYAASGQCSVCHTPKFQLMPADHEAGWVTSSTATPSGHSKAAEADASEVETAKEEWAKEREEFLTKKPRILMQLINVDNERPIDLPPAATVGTCSMCHDDATFCQPCHNRYKVTPAK